MKSVTILGNDAGQRVDKFLTKSYPNLPQSMLYKCIRKKDIKLNGKRCEISTRLQEGDILTMYLKDEFFQQKEEQFDFLKAPIKLNILYEDQNIMLLDKKPGLIVHPDEHYHFDSLIARIQHYLFERGEYRPNEENSFAPALINRIDRNTGGIVMAAKNAETLRIMNEKVKNRELQKLYLCIVHGKMEERERILNGYLQKKPKSKSCIYFSKSHRRWKNDKNLLSGIARKKNTPDRFTAYCKLICLRAVPTKFVPIWPLLDILLQATGNMAQTPSIKTALSPIKLFIPIV